MESLWANSAFAEPHIVLRLKLLPYSPGHEINLCAINSPFVTGAEGRLDDFFTAVLLCAHSFEEGQKLIRRPNKVRSFCWLWGLLLRIGWKPDMFHAELSRFRGYLSTGSWSPDTNRVVSRHVQMRTLKAPRVWRLVPFLCAHLGLTESQALNFPIARANAYYAAMADKAGDIDLIGEEDNDLLDYLKKIEAQEAQKEKPWDS